MPSLGCKDKPTPNQHIPSLRDKDKPLPSLGCKDKPMPSQHIPSFRLQWQASAQLVVGSKDGSIATNRAFRGDWFMMGRSRPHCGLYQGRSDCAALTFSRVTTSQDWDSLSHDLSIPGDWMDECYACLNIASLVLVVSWIVANYHQYHWSSLSCTSMCHDVS